MDKPAPVAGFFFVAMKWEGSFNEGMKLLRQHGVMPGKVLLKAEHLPYVPPDAMQELINKISALPELKVEHQSMRVAAPIPNRDDQEEVPAEVLRLREKGKRLLKQQSMLHAQLCAAQDDISRHEVATLLMEEVIPQIDEVYDTIRTWEKDGVLPASDRQEIVKDTIEKMRRIETLRTRISKLNTLLKGKISASDRLRYEKELVMKEIEQQELRSELGIE